MRTITKGDKTNADFGFFVNLMDIGFPQKRRITLEVPGRSGVLDFSSYYGGQIYEEREITLTLVKDCGTIQAVDVEISAVSNWLMDGFTAQIRDSRRSGWYINGTCIEVSASSSLCIATVKAKFLADPLWAREWLDGEIPEHAYDPRFDADNVLTYASSSVGSTITGTIINKAPSAVPCPVYVTNLSGTASIGSAIIMGGMRFTFQLSPRCSETIQIIVPSGAADFSASGYLSLTFQMRQYSL